MVCEYSVLGIQHAQSPALTGSANSWMHFKALAGSRMSCGPDCALEVNSSGIRTGHGGVPAQVSGPEILDLSQRATYDAAMAGFRTAVLVLGVVHALFVGLTALVGAFADGGGMWERLLLVLLHPLGAAGVLVLVFVPLLSRTVTIAIAAVLLANVIADLALAQRIAAGAVKGDWELALVFTVAPATAFAYALGLLRTRRPVDD